MILPHMKKIVPEHALYGIWNNAEDRWQYDYFGDVFQFSSLGAAKAQAQAEHHKYNGLNPVHHIGKQRDVMEAKEY